MSTSSSTSLTLGIAAAPPLALATFGLLLAVGMPPLPEWFWPTPTTNIAEAAALGDAARVRALAADGVPLDVPLPLRDEVRPNGAPSSMTPLEAAKWRGHDELVQLLLELGAKPSEDAATAAAP
ncbi:MAG: ankyrin repeat domain-containing protein [Acidobacteria bacterium]|nr:ankyrin repeat domain-containing protein [Acidobacteriota bacterium]